MDSSSAYFGIWEHGGVETATVTSGSWNMSSDTLRGLQWTGERWRSAEAWCRRHGGPISAAATSSSGTVSVTGGAWNMSSLLSGIQVGRHEYQRRRGDGEWTGKVSGLFEQTVAG